MLSWIVSNLSTIIICVCLAAVIAAVIAKLVRDKKNGRSACGCGCSGCAMANTCHKQKNSK